MTPQETVEQSLALSRADGCIVIADESSSANLRWANNTLTTNGVTRGRYLTVIATLGGATGTAAGVVSRSGVTSDTLAALVQAAEDAARGAGPAEDAAPLISRDSLPHDWDAPPAETSIAVFSSFAPALGEALGRAGAAGRALFGFASHHLTSTYIGSSTGLRLRHDQPSGSVELNAKSADWSRSAWTGAGTRDFSDIDVAALDASLEEQLGWADRRLDLPAGRYEALLPPSAVGDFMLFLYWSATARAAHEGRSVFSRPGGGTRVGEQLAAIPITLRSDPGAPGMECAPFVVDRVSGEAGSVFDTGLPLQTTEWIGDGVLRALLQTRHSARLAGLPLTPRIGNLVLSADTATATLPAMVAGTDRALLLTSLFYIRLVDPRTLLLTGLTRDGVYLVERGEVVGAVNNFRFNESPVSLLGRIAEAGATAPTLPREWSSFTRTAMPPLRIRDFNMSSVSPAS